MSRQHHVRIETNGARAEVEIDGHDIAYCVRELSIHAAGGEVPTVEVRLLPFRVDFEGDATVLALLDESPADRLAHLRSWPDRCAEEVSRAGIAQPCDRPVAAARDVGDGPYPVCAYHARAPMVPLARLLEGK